MADLPKWARTDDVEGAGGDLGDKLVEQSESDAKPPPPDEAADRVHDEEDVRVIEESPLASRALCLFRTLVVVTIILALAVIAANCYIIYDRFHELMARGILLRVYGILFCFFVVLAELEWGKFMKYFGFLRYWPARGLFYVFVGLITWDQNDSSSYATYEDIIAFMMVGVGAIYFLLGLCCMRTVKEAEVARLEEISEHS